MTRLRLRRRLSERLLQRDAKLSAAVPIGVQQLRVANRKWQASETKTNETPVLTGNQPTQSQSTNQPPIKSHFKPIAPEIEDPHCTQRHHRSPSITYLSGSGDDVVRSQQAFFHNVANRLGVANSVKLQQRGKRFRTAALPSLLHQAVQLSPACKWVNAESVSVSECIYSQLTCFKQE